MEREEELRTVPSGRAHRLVGDRKGAWSLPVTRNRRITFPIDQVEIETDVLVVGAGGAGMYAAIAAAREGARVLLADKSMVGRGGATIMAQMTVAAALGEQGPDDWTRHLADTLEAGRGLVDEPLAALLCEGAIERIRELDEWKVGWAREADGRMCQVTAPGHGVPRCVYVDFLNTGPAVAQCLRRRIAREPGITRASGLAVTDLVTNDGVAAGAVGFSLGDGATVAIAARAVVLATGGLTRLYRRNSASANMTGDGYALALRAGAELIDMEFPQFFPIGHLAPRLVGMDPIMWDPFRYKLGGRLLNAAGEEFVHRYGGEDEGRYVTTRDIISWAITKEAEAGRATPGGGVHLSFEHLSEGELREAFGPVIDRLAKNGIDLTRRPIEVSPIAHYHMGGVRVNEEMATGVPGLYAAGEAVGGASGANRLSGNAIPEALVFGETAGRHAARGAGKAAHGAWSREAARPHLERLAANGGRRPAGGSGRNAGPALGEIRSELADLMWEQVGVLRTGAGLASALERIRDLGGRLEGVPIPREGAYDLARQDWFDLRGGLMTAESVALTALNRTESRGAHQREDHPDTDPGQARSQRVRLGAGGRLACEWMPSPP